MGMNPIVPTVHMKHTTKPYLIRTFAFSICTKTSIRSKWHRHKPFSKQCFLKINRADNQKHKNQEETRVKQEN